MPEINADLHGMVPDSSDVVLILIDVINDLEFPGSELLVDFAMPMANKIAALKKRAKALGIPVIYVNDNFGRWRSDFRANVEHCLHDDVLGRAMVEKLQPEEDDYFVLKAKHSAFFSTNLDILLDYLKTKTLILTGLAGNICVLFTANDAYMRDFNIIVPPDCTASNYREDNENALHLMETVLKADITPSDQLDLKGLLQNPRSKSNEADKTNSAQQPE
jgi:nicotinamidase-related amidase